MKKATIRDGYVPQFRWKDDPPGSWVDLHAELFETPEAARTQLDFCTTYHANHNAKSPRQIDETRIVYRTIKDTPT